MMNEKATFAAGCFWGVEEKFRHVPGVIKTTVGYEGGTTLSPTYNEVCSDKTGHAEAIEIEYDPHQISYEELLQVFWQNHNPTQLNQQGPDIGTQYRSVIFYHTPEQRQLAETSKKNLAQSGQHRLPIVTCIEPAQTFYKAEEHHQRYLEKKGIAHCKIIDDNSSSKH
jgi:peptide-methionine (S)-S-oxide reductase